MITCRELIDFLSDYLDGDLPLPERAAFEEHMRVCPECRSYVESFKQTIELGRAALRRLDDEAPPEVPQSLVNAILAARKAGR
jgi:anti-sigma factor RsiW